MAACSDGFGLCASEVSAMSSKVSSEQNPIRSNLLFNKEPVARNLFTSRYIVDCD